MNVKGASTRCRKKYLTGKDHYRAARLQLFITEIYLELNNVEKAAEFSNNNLHLLALHATVKKLAASLYFAAINVELKRNDLSTAASYVDSLGPLINEPHETLIRFGYYMKKGHIHFRQQQYHEAHTNYQMAYQVASAMGHHAISINTSLQWLAATALKLGNYTTARAYAEEHLALAIRSRSKASRVEALSNLANYHQATGNSTTAFNTLSQVMQLKDSIAAETNLSQVNLLGAAYQKEMQDKEIGRLQNAQVMQDIKMNHKTDPWQKRMSGHPLPMGLPYYNKNGN
jgi:tetratricopeptide (TPR) repeat protein